MKVAARGSSTPSLRRMETIDEKDSAYNELSVSRDFAQIGFTSLIFPELSFKACQSIKLSLPPPRLI